MNPCQSRVPVWLLCLLLASISVGLYWPALQHEFICYDDPDYVLENELVNQGLTTKAVQLAFTQAHAGNWHPLAWLSHALDVELFGLSPVGHHLTNILLHATNAVLVFLLLNLLTGARWRSAFVAALFAWHPLHVESVAWVAERKDVLSGCFGLLTLLAYVRYANESKVSGLKSKVWYGAALLLFALGLMSKSMLVTWPFVLLLLDFWPLQRISLNSTVFSLESWQANRLLIMEKLPFLALAISASIITYASQSDASAVSEISFSTRLENALVAYALYLAKLFVPIKLAVFYPIPANFPALTLILALASLCAVTAVALRWVRAQPEWFFGWAFFLGTLFPVSGLAVQVGQQLMADRYTYLPALGIFIMISWTLAAGLARRPGLTLPGIGICGLILIGLLTLTRKQLSTWKNSMTLFEHALRVTENNHVAHNNLAAVLFRAGQEAEAGKHAAEALRLKPDYSDAHINFANELIRLERRTEAREHLEIANRLKPTPGAQYNLANLLQESGDFIGAESLYRQALEKRPSLFEARYNRALCLVKLGQPEEAISEFRAVIAVQPTNSGARLNLGSALAAQNRLAEATEVFQQQVSLTPDNTDARFNLAKVLQQLGRLPEAQEQFEAVLKSNPADVAARQGLGLTLAQTGQFNAAAAQLQQALKYGTNATLYYQLALVQMMQTDFTNAVASLQQALALETNAPMVLNDLAWVLATSPDPALRQPAEALRHALRACELTNHKVARFLGSLDAAYAATGQLDNAITTAQKVITLAEQNGETEIAGLAKARLMLYQQGRPYIQVLPDQTEPADKPK